MMRLEGYWNDQPHARRVRWRGLVAVMVVGLVGCDEGAVEPPAPGSVVVTTETTGFLQAESYELLVNGVSSGVIGASDQVTIADLDPQEYELGLGDVPDNCTGDVAAIAVESGQTAEVSLTVTCAYAEPAAYTIQFNRERPELDSGVVEVCPFGICASDESWDLYVYNDLQSTPSSVIRQNQSTDVEIAHLPGVTLDVLTEADFVAATFTTDWVGDAFDADRVILIRTELGNVYALGNPVEDRTNGLLSFDAALIATP